MYTNTNNNINNNVGIIVDMNDNNLILNVLYKISKSILH